MAGARLAMDDPASPRGFRGPARRLDAFAFKCVGVLLAGTVDNPIATFDAIRGAVTPALPAS
jgi:hypothetical protein